MDKTIINNVSKITEKKTDRMLRHLYVNPDMLAKGIYIEISENDCFDVVRVVFGEEEKVLEFNLYQGISMSELQRQSMVRDITQLFQKCSDKEFKTMINNLSGGVMSSEIQNQTYRTEMLKKYKDTMDKLEGQFTFKG